jgi:hypothetical protein
VLGVLVQEFSADWAGCPADLAASLDRLWLFAFAPLSSTSDVLPSAIEINSSARRLSVRDVSATFFLACLAATELEGVVLGEI